MTKFREESDMTSMPKTVRAPVPNCHSDADFVLMADHVTPGKIYEATPEPGSTMGFWITGDTGRRQYCLWGPIGCAQIGGRQWEGVV